MTQRTSASWAKKKILIRLWIERTKADKDAWPISKTVAGSIWLFHLSRSYIKNFPRLIRIWLATLYYRGPVILRPVVGAPFWLLRFFSSLSNRPAFVERLLPTHGSPTSLEDQIARLEAYGGEDAVSAPDREKISDAIALLTNRHIQKKFSEEVSDDLLDTLTKEGIVELSDLKLSDADVARIVAHLEQKPVYAAHVPAMSDGIPRRLADPAARQFPFGSYVTEDVVQAPLLLDLAFHPKVLSLVEAYLGCAPTLFSIHSWWSFPGHSAAGPQIFHRDVDDYRFLALFIFLTDVKGGEHGGEHDFICATHRLDTMARLLHNDREFAGEFFYPKTQGTAFDEVSTYKELIGDKIKTVTGKAGSIFLADTYALHRGVRPTQSGRLVCWIRFGMRKNLAYIQHNFQPVAFDWDSGRIDDDRYNRFVSRLVLK